MNAVSHRAGRSAAAQAIHFEKPGTASAAGPAPSRPSPNPWPALHRIDNRRGNLRSCTQAQNIQNKRTREAGKSRFRGVFPRGDKWQAAIQHDGRSLYLGLFEDEIEAARARDRKALELAGEFAILNFPEEAPETESAGFGG